MFKFKKNALIKENFTLWIIYFHGK